MSARAGWYEDPEAPALLRWWDGIGWTSTKADPSEPVLNLPGDYLGGWSTGPNTIYGPVPVAMTFYRTHIAVVPSARKVRDGAFDLPLVSVASARIEQMTPERARGWTVTTGLIGAGQRVPATTALSFDLTLGPVVLFRLAIPPPMASASLRPALGFLLIER